MTASASRTLRDGIAAALARDFDNAHQLLLRATTESPTDIRAWLWRALASPAPGDAIACLRRVLVFEPAHAEAQQALARLLAAQATAMAASEGLEQALALAREAAGLAPDCDAVWISLATLSEQPEERLDALRRAHGLNPLAPQTRGMLRDTLLRGGVATAASNPQAARELFREASTVDPSDPRVWQALARTAANAAESLGALRELFKLAPDRPGIRAAFKRALAADAESCAAAGSHGAALERWREAIGLDEQDPAMWLGLATVTPDRNEARRALAVVRRAGLDDPRVAALEARWDSDSEPASAPDFELASAPDLALASAPHLELASAPDPEPAPAAFAPPAQETPAAFAFAPRAPEAPAAFAFAPPAPEAPAAFPFAPPAAEAPAAFAFAPPAPEAPAAFAFAPPAPEPPPATLAPESPAPAAADDPFGAYAPPPQAAPAPFMPTLAAPPPSSFMAPPAAAAPAPLAPPPPAARPAAAAGAKRTVMIVDDSPTVRKILSMTLERAGYGVLAAADGEAALESLLTAVPDLILLDISMPKLDGYEVCKRVKADARTAHVPVVMLSGKDAFFDKVKGRMAGATEYLTKPFATPAVLAAVERMFEPETGAVHG